MAKYSLDKAISCVSEKLSEQVEECRDFITPPVDAMLLGGYALLSLAEKYGIHLERETNDIDLYSIEARTITALSGVVTPTGARLDLIDGLHAELFEWISGMDKEEYFNLINEGFTEENLIGTEGDVRIYRPTPAIFIVNKLYSSREAEIRRKKDLTDVATLVSILFDKDPKMLAFVEGTVDSFGLMREYGSAMNYLP